MDEWSKLILVRHSYKKTKYLFTFYVKYDLLNVARQSILALKIDLCPASVVVFDHAILNMNSALSNIYHLSSMQFY